MRIAFLSRPPTATGLTAVVVELLEEWGAQVELLRLDSDPADVVRRGHDLYVHRTVNAATLRYAAALDALGAALMNPYPVSRLCRNTEEVTALLLRAGVPVARSWLEGGPDHKLYCIGGRLFGVQRERPALTDKQKQGTPFTVTPELRRIALTVGQVIGADLYGIDVAISDGHPWVLEVKPFPGFKGVPQAALRVADHIWASAAAAMERPAIEVAR